MRLPRTCAVVFLAAVSTVGWANAGETCNRDWFYVNWPIENRMDLRQILLLERAVGDPIVYETPEGRQRVGRGTWVDELTGAVYRAIDPNALEEDLRDAEAKYGIDLKFQQLQIDHIIPLNWACEHGADQWSAKKRRDFATDELLLAITHSSVNASKGDQGPVTWQPPNADKACWYNKKFIYGIQAYGFDITIEEFGLILDNMESACRAASGS